jgi:hypothetical protein
MNSAISARRQLRRVLWFSEASIIAIAAVTAVQIATEQGGSIWACGPVAIIAVIETMRVPLSGWAAHLRPLAMLGAFIVIATISVLTFEGMSLAVERFMYQRVVVVAEARQALDAAQQKADDEAAADARYKTQFDRLTEEIGKRRQLVADLEGKQPTLSTVPSTILCKGVGKKGQPTSYPCKNPAADVAVAANADAQRAHAREVHDAQDSLTKLENRLNALVKPDHAKETEAAVADAQNALEKAAAD